MFDETLLFSSDQLERLTRAFHSGAAVGSDAMQRWLGVPTLISIDSVDQCPMEMATGVLGQTGDAVGMCLMRMQGTFTGLMVLAFEDSSGLAMTDLILGHAPGTAVQWGELEMSAALESMNILGSAYLNGMADFLSRGNAGTVELIPSPPRFVRDFAESLLQTAFMEQAVVGSHMLFARARFEMRGRPLKWTFLLIPDPPSLVRLAILLSEHFPSDAAGTP